MNMIFLIGIIYSVIGFLFFAYGIIFFYLSETPLELGFFLNNILLIGDILWGLVLGCVLLITGVLIILKNRISMSVVTISGYAVIYSYVFILFSFIFNTVVKPYLQTNCRIFSFSIQAFSRLLHPSFSLAFFIPLFGVLIFLFLSFLFKQYFIKIIQVYEVEE